MFVHTITVLLETKAFKCPYLNLVRKLLSTQDPPIKALLDPTSVAGTCNKHAFHRSDVCWSSWAEGWLSNLRPLSCRVKNHIQGRSKLNELNAVKYSFGMFWLRRPQPPSGAWTAFAPARSCWNKCLQLSKITYGPLGPT